MCRKLPQQLLFTVSLGGLAAAPPAWGTLLAICTACQGHRGRSSARNRVAHANRCTVSVPVLHEAGRSAPSLSGADGPVLPKVRVSSQMEPNKGSLPASRQNSLPDLGLPRMTRKRSSNLRPGARTGARGSLVRQMPQLWLQLWQGRHTSYCVFPACCKHTRSDAATAGGGSATQVLCTLIVCSAVHSASGCPWDQHYSALAP